MTRVKTTESSKLILMMTISAWLCFLLLLFILIKGEQILLQVKLIYPSLLFPAFFIPWFLLLISSVQKLRDSKSRITLQVFILKTTIPLFIFASPFLSHYLSFNVIFEEFQAYAIYLAIVGLFFIHFLPVFKTK